MLMRTLEVLAELDSDYFHLAGGAGAFFGLANGHTLAVIAPLVALFVHVWIKRYVLYHQVKRDGVISTEFGLRDSKTGRFVKRQQTEVPPERPRK